MGGGIPHLPRVVFVFLSAKIYADMGLQTYYVGISIYGFYQWTRKKHETHTENDSLPSDRILYTHLSLPLFVGIIGTLAVVFAILWYLLHQFTDSPIPVGDAFTTSVGIVATWMLARRIIEHWIFWVIVNLVSVYLYYLRGLYPTMLCDTSHSRLLQLAEERGRVLNYEF